MNVLLCGKKVLAHVLKLRILRWEGYPGLSMWAQRNLTVSYKRKVGVSETQRDLRMLCWLAAGWRTSGIWKLEKERKLVLS
jgi:hypothetical protein